MSGELKVSSATEKDVVVLPADEESDSAENAKPMR